MLPLSIYDLQRLARRRIPRMFYDYVDAGSWTESTYKANEADLTLLKLRQRVAQDISRRSMETKIVAQPATMPVALAPVGLTGMMHADGEILAAAAAARFGAPFTLSTMSICSIEDVASAVTAPFWFQLYVMRDRGFVADLIDRAKGAGCSALMVTLDLQILGQRHKDIRNGLSTPPKLNFSSFLQMATRPAWCAQMLGARRRDFGNIVGHVKGVSNLASLSTWVAEQFDPTLSWADIEWIKKRWGGKLILKGIMDPEDAAAATAIGADAIVVSNHGGRQLDGAPSSISALQAIAEAVGDRIEVQFDGGIRSGQDVFRALCLGAKSVYVGRAFIYGLAALGEVGVKRALEIIQMELDKTMALCGVTRIEDLSPRNLVSGVERGR